MPWVGCAHHGYGDDLLYDSLLFNMKHMADKNPRCCECCKYDCCPTVMTDLDHTKKNPGIDHSGNNALLIGCWASAGAPQCRSSFCDFHLQIRAE